MLDYYCSKYILRLSSGIYAALTNLTHVCAWSPKMDYLRLQAVHYQPGTITLISFLIQVPTSFICDGVLVEAFGSGTSSFSNSDSQLAKSSEQLGKVDSTIAQPLLELRAGTEVDWMVSGFVFIRHTGSTTSNKLLNLCAHKLAICRLLREMHDRARGRYKTRLAGLRLKVNRIAFKVAYRFFLIGIA